MADHLDLRDLQSARQQLPQAPVAAPQRTAALARVRHRLPAAFGAQLRSLASQGIVGPASAFSTAISALTPDTETLRDAYVQEPWFAAAINLLSSSSSQVPLRLWDRDPDDEDAIEVTSGPVFDLFQRPGLGMDPALRTMTDAINLALSGESFWLMLDANREPVRTMGEGSTDSFFELPAFIQPLIGFKARPSLQDQRTAEVYEWEFTRGTYRDVERWDASAVIQLIERPDHRDERRGRGLGLMAQSYSTAVEMFMARRYTRIMLENLGDPGGVVEIDSWLGDDEYERLVLQAEDALANPNRNGSPLVLQGGAQYRPGRVTPRDMAWEALLDTDLQQLAAVLITPPALMGLQAENFATFRGHFRTYMTMRLRPFFAAIARRLNTLFFPRLRDRSMRTLRCRFDLEQLTEAIGDLEEQGAGVKALTGAGVPLDEALRQGGIKADPIPGGDVSMVETGQMARPAAVLLSQAQAAKAAQDAGMEREQAWELAGVEGARLAEPLDLGPQGAPGAPGAPGSEPGAGPGGPAQQEDPDGGPPAPAEASVARRGATSTPRPPARYRAGEPPTSPEAAAQAVVTRSPFDTEGGRLAYWLRVDAPLERHRAPFVKDWRAVARDMARAQIKALEDFAAGRTVRSAEPRPVYPDPLPTIAPSAIRGWLAASMGDAVETAVDRGDADPEATPASVAWCGCDVEPVQAEVTERREEWHRRHPRYADIAWSRLDDLAVMRDFTEGEIDLLIVIQDAKWRTALADVLESASVASYEDGAEVAGKEIGVAIPDATNPDYLRFFKDKAILVAEGSTSTLARRLRKDILRVLASDGSITDLREAVATSLKDLKATTTRAFNSYAARAQTIARTELGQAWSMARWDMAKTAHEAGALAAVVWVTSGRGVAPIGTVRPSHYNQDAVERKPGEEFPNGLRYPREPGGPAGEVINCWTGDTIVQPVGDLRLMMRRLYDGPLVRYRSETGVWTTVTPHHPVVTARGTVPAIELHEGDQLIAYPRGELPGPYDVDHAPAPIEELFGACGSLRHVRGRPGDFHGDGREGDVHVVSPDGKLPVAWPEMAEGLEHLIFTGPDLRAAGPESAPGTAAHRSAMHPECDAIIPSGGVSAGDSLHPLVAAHAAGRETLGGVATARLHASRDQVLAHRAARTAESFRNGLLRESGKVRLHKIVRVEVWSPAAPVDVFNMHTESFSVMVGGGSLPTAQRQCECHLGLKAAP